MSGLSQYLGRMIAREFISEPNRHPRTGLWPLCSVWWLLGMLLTVGAEQAPGQEHGTPAISLRSSTLAATSLSQEAPRPPSPSGVSDSELPSDEAESAASTTSAPTEPATQPRAVVATEEERPQMTGIEP